MVRSPVGDTEYLLLGCRGWFGKSRFCKDNSSHINSKHKSTTFTSATETMIFFLKSAINNRGGKASVVLTLWTDRAAFPALGNSQFKLETAFWQLTGLCSDWGVGEETFSNNHTWTIYICDTFVFVLNAIVIIHWAIKPEGCNTTANTRKPAASIESWRLEGAEHYCLALKMFWEKEKVRAWHIK